MSSELGVSGVKNSIEDVSPETCLAFGAANFAEVLRHSYFVKGRSIKLLIPQIKRIADECSDSQASNELLHLMKESDGLLRSKGEGTQVAALWN
jgi:hypothetical protein